ncbi:MAG: hypothetical protein NTZ54_13125, partial [Alphaproteobacteria bacterium]|nr:hypothetical protein [Alphaproteobacteria bacterium]
TPVHECWEVNQQIYGSHTSTYGTSKVLQAQQIYYTARDARFKFVHSNWKDYDPVNSGVATSYTLDELYEVNESKNWNDLKLDRDGDALYTDLNGDIDDNLNSVKGAAESMRALQDYLAALFATQPPCRGDGNGDRIVNVKDIRDYWRTVRTWTASSTFDFDYNAVTDRNDLQTILENIPKDCRN